MESSNSDKYNHSFDYYGDKLDTNDPVWHQLFWWMMIGFVIGLTIDIVIFFN